MINSITRVGSDGEWENNSTRRWMSITNGGLTVDDFEEHFVL
ncbi:hypothetical protein IHE45_01G049100 [Dioscorea alata]|uniref:Uncharacterized protein n=1 Tax=Dioscorea alata TaxID=55571 RepID=A0ACB7WUD1_DIOAL|nr:hypothetical protein IHE45_01G049100 [Dioscorea alata]